MVDKRIDKVEPSATESLANLVIELHNIKDEVRYFNQKNRSRFLITIVFVVVVALFGIGNLITNQNVRRVSDQIADCIKTTGKCYQSGSRRTGGAVKGIVDEAKLNTIASGWCQTQRPATLIDFRKCVDQARAVMAK
jgi:hypothetical protein